MSTPDFGLHPGARLGITARSRRAPSASAWHLLAVVALASAAVGGVAAVALERVIAAMEPPLAAPVPRAAAMPLPAGPGLPAVHDVLRDRAEPPAEPPPAS